MTGPSSGSSSRNSLRNGAGNTSKSPATRLRTAGSRSATSAGTRRTRWTSSSRAATRVKTKCTGRSGNSTTSPTLTSHRWTNCSSIRKPNCLKSEVPADIPEESAEPEKPKRRTGRNLPAAFIVGAGMGGLAILTLFTVKATFLVYVAVVVGVALWELSRAVAARQIRLPVPPVAAGGALALALAYWKGERPLLACFVALMLAAPDGPRRTLVLLIVTVCSDVGGYFAGITIGRHLMAPAISPKKTWEGFGGSAFACILGGAISLPLLLHGAVWQGILLGAAALCTAALGDLAESMMKRDLEIKDMGTVLPGHGGILDRIDSLLITAPVIWLLLLVFIPVVQR